MTTFRLALEKTLHERGRTAASIVGTGFAVALIFMQLGFFGAVENTASLLYKPLHFDLLLASSEYIDLGRPGTLPRTRLAQAHAAGGVADVVPLSIAQAIWRNPTDDPLRGGKRWQISALACDPSTLDRLFRPDGEVFHDAEDRQAARAALGLTDVVLLDRKSRPDFGDPDRMPPGTRTELNGQRIELGGYFQIGTGFSYTGLLLLSEETFTRVTGRPDAKVTFGLVTLAPGLDPNEAAEKVRAVLPPDVLVFTRGELTERERRHWVRKTAVGQLFYCGVMLALVVGAIFVYQMMAADIKKHLPEFATLKAIGYRFGYLFRVVVWQAIFLAVGGYAGGLAASFGLYELTRAAARMPIEMTPDRMVIVLALTLGMCVGSGLIAVRKVRTTDPADLF